MSYLLWSSDHFPRIETHLTAILRFPPFLATDQLEVTQEVGTESVAEGGEGNGKGEGDEY